MVRVTNSYSNECDALSGVPQGSVLGLVLFLIYVSDLTTHCKSNPLAYADDLKLFGPLSQALQEDINRISEWCSD